MKKFKCIAICENQYDDVDVYEFDNLKEMWGFERGFTEGAGHYGCGSVATYDLANLDELDPKNKDDAQAIKAIIEHCACDISTLDPEDEWEAQIIKAMNKWVSKTTLP